MIEVHDIVRPRPPPRPENTLPDIMYKNTTPYDHRFPVQVQKILTGLRELEERKAYRQLCERALSLTLDPPKQLSAVHERLRKKLEQRQKK